MILGILPKKIFEEIAPDKSGAPVIRTVFNFKFTNYELQLQITEFVYGIIPAFARIMASSIIRICN